MVTATDTRGADPASPTDDLGRRFGRETSALGAAGIGARSFDAERTTRSRAETKQTGEAR